jgi:hypothetical protein
VRKYRARVQFPEGTPIRVRLRVAWALIKFMWALDHATREKQEAVFGYLANNGATVTSKIAEQTGDSE